MNIKTLGVKTQRSIEQFWEWMKVQYRLYAEDKVMEVGIKGTNELTEEEKQQVKAFYKPYFKAKLTSHQFYKEKTGEFHVDYIPDYIWYGYIDPYYNDWKLDKYIDNKCYYSRMFPDVDQPETILVRLNGYWLDKNNSIISLDSAKEIINNSRSPLFLKMAGSYFGCGGGVAFYNPLNREMEKLDPFFSSREDLMVQAAIKQHSSLEQINKSSVNTYRLLSMLKKDGSVQILSSVLRMGRNGKKVDNEASGGLSCGINDDGSLKSVAYSKYGDRFTEHPDSHVVFEGYHVPSYENVREIVVKNHPLIPHFRMVSWDIAVDENGVPLLIEINTAYGGLSLHQLNNGPIFGDETKEILDEVFKKRI